MRLRAFVELLRDLCRAQYERFRKGDYVFKQGDEGSEMYILLSGLASVRVARNPETDRPMLGNDRKGAVMVAKISQQRSGRFQRKTAGIDDSKVVGMIKPGDRFGEMANVERSVRLA